MLFLSSLLQADAAAREDKIYDAVIVGGGISGLTTAYMLRDGDILLLEKENRFGGRVWSEQIDGIWYNVGTQYLMEDDNSLIRFLDDLQIQRVPCPLDEFPTAAYIDGTYYKDLLDIPLGFGQMIDVFEIISLSYRKGRIFTLSPEDPQWQELAGMSLAELFRGYDQEVMALFNAYLRGACATKPENTSAGIGVMLMGDIYNVAPFSFVEGGTQHITDVLVEKLGGKLRSGAEVIRVSEKNGLVHIIYRSGGREHVVRAKKAVLATPAPITLRLLPDVPSWKREALARTRYGTIITINVFLKKIPWERFNGMLVGEGKIFNGIIDATYAMEFSTGRKDMYPKILSFFISVPPEEQERQREVLSRSDASLVQQVVREFEEIISLPLKEYVIGSRVTRFPVGEVGITPEYFTELLPLLKKPTGNIHFCGDYTDRSSFLMGSVLSAFRAARELGSTVVPEEIRFAETSLWGTFGWIAVLVHALLIGCGVFLKFRQTVEKIMLKRFGILLIIIGLLMMVITLLFPYLLPPYQEVYLLFVFLSVLLAVVGFVLLKIIQK
jgi:oxygen-dependent protoporphyrinogen oxidase